MTDIEYLFPFGWGAVGIASRTDFDLKQHAEHSGTNMEYHGLVHQRKIYPLLHRAFIGRRQSCAGVLCDAYDEETLEGGDVRNVLRLHPALAPFKVAVLPCRRSCQRKRRRYIVCCPSAS